jgi:Copper type II ascorbate-dependent monooxygenase, C-terminal domain
MPRSTFVSSAACLLLFCACESESRAATAKSAADGVDAEVASRGDAGATEVSAPLVMRTGDFTIEAGKERYLCFTKTLEDDAVIGGYSHAGQPFVHHILFVRTLVPEPDGFSECDTLFRQTWDPLFISGAGDSTLQFPSDAGHKLTKGTQLLVQLHLLNSSDEDAHSSVEVQMHRSAAQDPRPVSTYVFGTTNLHLPPKQASEVQSTCEMKEHVELIAAFPHEHLLGTGLRFEAGPSADAMQPLFAREPYSFDDQHTENVSIKLEPGDVTRVTCSYQNPDSNEVTFGESTHNEMCFFVGFALDRDSLSSCLTSSPKNPASDGE